MSEKHFFWICCVLFLISASTLSCFVLLSSDKSFEIEPYSTKVTCEGSCTFRATILGVSDKNETMFYKLSREVVVDSVFFVGLHKPTFTLGDCVIVSGIVQTYKGRESIVAQTMRTCGNGSK